MKMTFEVTYQDGRKVQSIAMPKDFVAFERQYGKSMTSISEGAPFEWIFYLAWSPLHRLRQEPADFDGFLDIVEDVTPLEETPAAATDPSSPELSDAVSA